MPEFKTARLVLRPIEPADVPALAEVYADPDVVRYLTPLDAAGTAKQVAAFCAEWQERGYGILAVLDRETGRFLGRSGLHHLGPFEEPEVGWVLRRDAWGNGYATEAATASLRWAFDNLGLDSVIAVVARENVASAAVARRIGMRPLRDDVVYGYAVTVWTTWAATAATKMHADELDVDDSLVRALLAEQLPGWSALPISRVPSPGTSNAIFRLGDAMSVRMPRTPGAAEQNVKEQRWLPFVGPHLPLAVPTVLAKGVPGAGFPWPWSVYDWLPGTPASVTPFDHDAAARDLATFVLALRAVDASEGPAPGSHNFGRGVPLAARDTAVRDALARCEGLIDTDAAAAAWDRALAAPAWDGPPLWLHGDLNPWNLLVTDGRVTGVVDFGGLGAGDPATDLLPAWLVLNQDARETFRAALGADDAMWERGRGWALSMGLIALPYYRVTNPPMATLARHAIDAVLA